MPSIKTVAAKPTVRHRIADRPDLPMSSIKTVAARPTVRHRMADRPTFPPPKFNEI